MTLFICVPIRVSGMLCVGTAGNDHNPTSFFHPANELVTVLAFIRQDHLTSQFKRLQQTLCHTDVIAVSAGEQKMQRIPKPIRYRMDFCRLTSPAPSGFFVIPPFLPPLAC